MVITTSVYSDLQTPGFPPIINAVQGEQYSRRIKLALYSAGVAWTVPAGVYVAMRYKKPDGTKGYYDIMPDGTQAWSTEENVVNIYVAPQMLTAVGVVLAQVEIILNDSILATFPLRLRVAENLAAPLQTSEDYVNWLQWMEDQLALRWADAVESGELTGPQGPKGDTGDPAVLESSVVEYQASDSGEVVPSGAWSQTIPVVPPGKYLWTRMTSRFNTGAPVVTVFPIYFGLNGTGATSSVCGVSPGPDGDVKLTAKDVGAMPTTGGDFTGPINMNGQKLSGLNSPTADDEAATKGYAAGLRVQDLIRNGDFQDPVNQRGLNAYSGAKGYSIDGWIRDQDLTLTLSGGGIRLSSAGNDWWASITQAIEIKDADKGKSFTFAVRGTFPNSMRLLALSYNSSAEFGIKYFEPENVQRTLILNFQIPVDTAENVLLLYISPDTDTRGKEAEVQWAALYPGTYTAETVPPHVPNGYAAELMKCCRYYFEYSKNLDAWIPTAYPIGAGAILVDLTIQKMRILPTVANASLYVFDDTGAWVEVDTILINETPVGYVLFLQAKNASIIPGNSYLIKGKFSLSADM